MTDDSAGSPDPVTPISHFYTGFDPTTGAPQDDPGVNQFVVTFDDQGHLNSVGMTNRWGDGMFTVTPPDPSHSESGPAWMPNIHRGTDVPLEPLPGFWDTPIGHLIDGVGSAGHAAPHGPDPTSHSSAAPVNSGHSADTAGPMAHNAGHASADQPGTHGHTAPAGASSDHPTVHDIGHHVVTGGGLAQPSQGAVADHAVLNPDSQLDHYLVGAGESHPTPHATAEQRHPDSDGIHQR